MPNWCDNTLRVSGPEEEVARFREQAKGFEPGMTPEPGQLPEALNFHRLIPVPGQLLVNESLDFTDWEETHWGCKWGACNSQIVDEWDERLIYTFETPWSPPLEFIEQVSKEWPTLIFVLEYEESGNGFKGLARAEAGKLEDHCIDL